ncbi:hypothetical protein LB518_24110, partial [Mesorhizobium sp. BR1-1-16]|uniref:hypothetical protein n=1 Tax=Mesorhizobium sp. BR1-1-16 TaxID=2876653 RepID=UPI001CCDE98C
RKDNAAYVSLSSYEIVKQLTAETVDQRKPPSPARFHQKALQPSEKLFGRAIRLARTASVPGSDGALLTTSRQPVKPQNNQTRRRVRRPPSTASTASVVVIYGLPARVSTTAFGKMHRTVGNASRRCE